MFYYFSSIKKYVYAHWLCHVLYDLLDYGLLSTGEN